ncbi:hypothetical protein BCY75_09355 [Latilactobacillus curvatus]|uniref:putative phage abortive infection protein n=1 Tax=Latilactobacillus curvatus TaxID=28038 RepID=UPI00081534C8|nr:putative phage abortive infection protein [Latilactobacillus curvatus]ANY14185.1 hypothetical protein BCY75_09355 [Latilactobacillus curvatus]
MTITNGISLFLKFNKLSTYITPIWKWLSDLEPSAFIALLALITTLITFSITSMNNRKTSFENLFFHLISLLREILKLDENSSNHIKSILQTIDKESMDKLKKNNDNIKLNIYVDNEELIHEFFITLENLELKSESKKRMLIMKDTSSTEKRDIRKAPYLIEIKNIEDLETYSLSTNKYETFPNAHHSSDPLIMENFTEELYHFCVAPDGYSEDLFTLFNTPSKKKAVSNHIKKLCEEFPCKKQNLIDIQNKMFSIFTDNDARFQTEIPEDDKKTIVSDFLSKNEFGSFFRTVHRIIKIILNFSVLKRSTTINKYLGILRTQLSEEQLILLFYNAEYTKRGEKFKNIVSKVNLWGDSDELDTSDNKEPTHFKSSALIWPDSDLKILRQSYIYK